MAATTAIGAVIELYNGLDQLWFPDDERPPIFLDDAPQPLTGAPSDTQQRVPYVIIKDGGEKQTQLAASMKYSCTQSVTMVVWYEDLDDANLAFTAICYGDGTPPDRLGMLNVALPLEPPLYSAPVGIWGMGPYRRLMGRNKNNQYVYGLVQNWRLQYYSDYGRPTS